MLGKMISTHGAWCTCSMGCANRRKWEGPTLAEQRRMLTGEAHAEDGEAFD